MFTFGSKLTNRFAFCLGALPSDDQVDYKRVMPFARSWKAILILGLISAPFWYAEITILNQAVSSWSEAENLFMLISALFLTFWLAIWSLPTLIVTLILVVLISGRGVLLIYGGRVEIHVGIPWVGAVVRIAAAQVKDVCLVDPDPRSVFASQGKQLQITSEGEEDDSPIGGNMTEHDVSLIKQAIDLNRSVDSKLFGDEQAVQEQRKKDKASRAALANAAKYQSDEPHEPSRYSLWALILANLVPLAGVLIFGWSLPEIMVLYWVETAIIALYHIAKNIVISPYLGLFSALLTLCKVGGFMALHFLFIWLLFVKTGASESERFGSSTQEAWLYISALWPAILSLLFSHGHSFMSNFMASSRRYSNTEVDDKEVFSRVLIMHLTVILGGGLAMIIGEPIWALAILVGLKLLADLHAHTKLHRS